MRAANRLLAVVLAAAVVALAALVVFEIVRAALGDSPGVLRWHGLPDTLAAHRWRDGVVRAAGFILAAAGLLLLVPGLRRGKPATLALAGDTDGVSVVTTRRSLTKALTSSTADVEGVDDSRVTLKRRTARNQGAQSAAGPR